MSMGNVVGNGEGEGIRKGSHEGWAASGRACDFMRRRDLVCRKWRPPRSGGLGNSCLPD